MRVLFTVFCLKPIVYRELLLFLLITSLIRMCFLFSFVFTVALLCDTKAIRLRRSTFFVDCWNIFVKSFLLAHFLRSEFFSRWEMNDFHSYHSSYSLFVFESIFLYLYKTIRSFSNPLMQIVDNNFAYIFSVHSMSNFKQKLKQNFCTFALNLMRFFFFLFAVSGTREAYAATKTVGGGKWTRFTCTGTGIRLQWSKIKANVTGNLNGKLCKNESKWCFSREQSRFRPKLSSNREQSRFRF